MLLLIIETFADMSLWRKSTFTVLIICHFFGKVRTLSGSDIKPLVQEWSRAIQKSILQLANETLRRDQIQKYFDLANYTTETINGMSMVNDVKEKLGNFFRQKEEAVTKLANMVRSLHDDFNRSNKTSGVSDVGDLGRDVFKDADPIIQPHDTTYSSYFRDYVSFNYSVVKIPDDVPQNNRNVTDAISYTAELDKLFKENAEKDPLLSWQYFGSVTGIYRMYPGQRWAVDFVGNYEDYDPRNRPWYIAATSGPKDVIVILDCSLSMSGPKLEIAKEVAITVIKTLTKQDYVNVVCARSTHWDSLGKYVCFLPTNVGRIMEIPRQFDRWRNYSTEVLGCKQDQMVPASLIHRQHLIDNIKRLHAGGTTELEVGFETGFDLLARVPRMGCQSIIVFATDGKDSDGNNVRCGPGNYVRSGFLPGPICKSDWSNVLSTARRQNSRLTSRARIFTYIVQGSERSLAAKLSCRHNGSFKVLTSKDNMISQMSNYFGFLSSNAEGKMSIWTSPYLDIMTQGLMVTHAMSVISDLTKRSIGVIAVDASLGEIEALLTNHLWGSVYSFLINKRGETIFHPLLKPSHMLISDPVFIPITKLERDKGVDSEEFSVVEKKMREGQMGSHQIPSLGRTYYFASLNYSEYSFAYSMADNDMDLRIIEDQLNTGGYGSSFFHFLDEYNSSIGRLKIPGAYEYLNVTEDPVVYPGQQLSYAASTVFLAPSAYCDPTTYLYDDDSTANTVELHAWMSSPEPDLGCKSGRTSAYTLNKGIRAEIKTTQPIEGLWKNQEYLSNSQVTWRYLGLRSGLLRTYPGHRSKKSWDPSKQPWYKEAKLNPAKTVVSSPYLGLPVTAKTITISQAFFEGVFSGAGPNCSTFSYRKPGGCSCSRHEECISGVCYITLIPKSDNQSVVHHCASEHLQGVAGMDITYAQFHDRVQRSISSKKQQTYCGQKYACGDGESACQTRCYLFDSKAHLVTKSEFLTLDTLRVNEYTDVPLGRKEAEVMKDLVYTHGMFEQDTFLDIQGTCQISPEFEKVTLEGMPVTPEEQENYYRIRGPIRKFGSQTGCVQDVVRFKLNDSFLDLDGTISGTLSGPCTSGTYYVTAIPTTNLYLLVIHRWKSMRAKVFYDFNCHLIRRIVDPGVYKVANGMCISAASHPDNRLCPALRHSEISCFYTTGSILQPSLLLVTGLICFQAASTRTLISVL